MEEKRAGISEDWLSLWIGLFIFVLSLGVFGGLDILGWGASTRVWTDPAKALAPVSTAFQTVKGEIVRVEGRQVTLRKPDGAEQTLAVEDAAGLRVGDPYEKGGISGILALILTYLFMMAIMGVGAAALQANVGRFVTGFTIVFWVAFACWFLGHNAYIAALDPAKEKIPWSLRLSGEAGYILALAGGLIVGNFFPRFAKLIKEATRPELYVKTAIVVMGAALGVKAAEQLSLASAVIFRGLCAIVEAYLIYWAVVYFIARKYFKFSREWAAPLASGISICGVSAAIATGGAIRARPVVPIMVSSLVVIFAVIELVVLPFFAQTFLWKEPLVAGAWMGLAVKTDGAAVTSGAVADSLIRAQALKLEGINYAEGWITMTATTVKIFIDVFIGIWAFVLAYIWCAKIESKPGERVGAGEIWKRFPKFVIGYALTFAMLLWVCLPSSKALAPAERELKQLNQEIAGAQKELALTADAGKQGALRDTVRAAEERVKSLSVQIREPKAFLASAKLATEESNIFRVMFFLLTFFTIGVVSNFRKLWEEGIGRLAAVYVLCLFGFIIWVGLIISWIFFHGVKPPVIAG